MKSKIAIEPKDSSKKFLLEFFKDTKIKDENGVLTVEDVPPAFEEFVGKKAPYKFVFDINSHDKITDSELIMQGSYFLLAIRDYLSDKGQTSLLKINLKQDLAQIGKTAALKKYKILEVKPGKFDSLYQFHFLSKYQYLNDKKQSTSTLLIKNKDVLEMDSSKVKITVGNKEEISEIEPSESYETAKKILDKKVCKEILPINLILKEKLQKELLRIKDHYAKQIHEKDEEVETCANKIKMLQSKLRHTSYQRDINILERMIRESKERLEMLKQKGYRERLETEKLFHINDEVEKHVLSIKNSLVNVTVFYYPTYEFVVSIKGKKSSLKYDPILDKIIS